MGNLTCWNYSYYIRKYNVMGCEVSQSAKTDQNLKQRTKKIHRGHNEIKRYNFYNTTDNLVKGHIYLK